MPVYSESDILGVPPGSWEFDWFGLPVRYRAHFRFALYKERLTFCFEANKEPECEDLPSGTFRAGLWERDVAEFFLMGPNGDYQEFNLSPSGAWWSASFTGHRQQSEELPCPSVVVAACSGGGRWTAQLSVALVDIKPLQGFCLSQCRLNPTAILAPGQPEYLCYGHSSGGQPDFHREDNFLPIVVHPGQDRGFAAGLGTNARRG